MYCEYRLRHRPSPSTQSSQIIVCFLGAGEYRLRQNYVIGSPAGEHFLRPECSTWLYSLVPNAGRSPRTVPSAVSAGSYPISVEHSPRRSTLIGYGPNSTTVVCLRFLWTPEMYEVRYTVAAEAGGGGGGGQGGKLPPTEKRAGANMSFCHPIWGVWDSKKNSTISWPNT